MDHGNGLRTMHKKLLAIDLGAESGRGVLDRVEQGAAIARAWSMVHGFTMLLLDGRLGDILHRLPAGTTPDQLLDAMLRSTVARPPGT